MGGGKAIWAHGKKNSKGVAILFKRNLEFKILSRWYGTEGRYLVLKIDIAGEILTICNIYAPVGAEYAQQKIFFDDMNRLLGGIDTENLLIAGDFNLAPDPLLDRKCAKEVGNENQVISKLNSLKEEFGLEDVWRNRNPEQHRFTFHRGFSASRIDFWLIQEQLLGYIIEADIGPGVFSDHSMVSVDISFDKNRKRGPGLWKFNNSLLQDTEFIEKINDLLGDLSKETEGLDPIQTWEFEKYSIRKFTVKYSKAKSSSNKQLEKDLETELACLESLFDLGIDVESEMNSVRKELSFLNRQKTIAACFRSRCQWASEGEKPTAYFLKLEKDRAAARSISCLRDNSNNLLKDPKKISSFQVQFFENLYSNGSTEGVNRGSPPLGLQPRDFPRVDPILADRADQDLTEDDLLSALKQMKNGKSPGSDGFSVDFYKVFWPGIKKMVLESLTFGLKRGTLSMEQRRGVVCLIPIKKKDRLDLRNWHPPLRC